MINDPLVFNEGNRKLRFNMTVSLVGCQLFREVKKIDFDTALDLLGRFSSFRTQTILQKCTFPIFFDVTRWKAIRKVSIKRKCFLANIFFFYVYRCRVETIGVITCTLDILNRTL